MKKAMVAQFYTSKALSWYRVLHENCLVFYFSTAKEDRQTAKASPPLLLQRQTNTKMACLCDSLLGFVSPSSNQTRHRLTPAISFWNPLCLYKQGIQVLHLRVGLSTSWSISCWLWALWLQHPPCFLPHAACSISCFWQPFHLFWGLGF